MEVSLFDGAIGSLRVVRHSFDFRYPSARYHVEFVRSYFGPLFNAFESLDAEGRENLKRDLIELVNHPNRSGYEIMIVSGEDLDAMGIRKQKEDRKVSPGPPAPAPTIRKEGVPAEDHEAGAHTEKTARGPASSEGNSDQKRSRKKKDKRGK